jgi:hypothetical protein
MQSLGLFMLSIILLKMTRFYEIWLNEKTSIREAFNRTQLEIKVKGSSRIIGWRLFWW